MSQKKNKSEVSAHMQYAEGCAEGRAKGDKKDSKKASKVASKKETNKQREASPLKCWNPIIAWKKSAG